jgi:hypothetical protein
LESQPIAAIFSKYWPGDKLETHGEKAEISSMDKEQDSF